MLFLQTTCTGSGTKVRGISPIYSQIFRELESSQKQPMVSQGQNSRFSPVFSSSVCYRHCLCTETSFVFTQQLALWRVQVRHSASWKAKSLLFSLPENGIACVSSPGRFGVSSPRPVYQCASVCALQGVTVSRKHFALQFSYKSILGGVKFSCWLPCHGTPPPSVVEF